MTSVISLHTNFVSVILVVSRKHLNNAVLLGVESAEYENSTGAMFFLDLTTHPLLKAMS